MGNNDVEVPTGDDKWEKWPDHWRLKGTPTVVANYGAGTVVVDDDDAGPIGVESSEEEERVEAEDPGETRADGAARGRMSPRQSRRRVIAKKVVEREQVVQGGSGEDDERRLRRQGHGDAAEEDALEAPLVAVGERGLGDAREVHG